MANGNFADRGYWTRRVSSLLSAEKPIVEHLLEMEDIFIQVLLQICDMYPRITHRSFSDTFLDDVPPHKKRRGC